jgi:hypothetical protein
MRIRFAYFTVIASLSLLALLAGSARPAHTQNTGGQDCSEAANSTDGCNTIEGSSFNQVEPGVVGATISGGGQRTWPNQVRGDFGSVCGGLDNRVGEIATVCGGSHNLASVVRTFVGGGMDNKATADSAAIVGGLNNQATGRYAFVGGGFGNRATDLNATVGGGVSNVASGAYATIGGGTENIAASLSSTVAGGAGNQARADGGAIAGGIANRILDNYSVVSGGWANQAGDGEGDLQDSAYASIGGGKSNIASGAYATVPGGASNRAEGDYSFAAGRSAVALHDGSLVLADANPAEFTSAAANELAVRATGGVRLVTAIDAAGEPLAGASLPAGSGAWATLSDREAKMDFAPVDSQQILSRLAALPIQTWRYKAQPGEIRHLGPAAQDFYAAFGVGEGDRTISTVDADGVALASIQALYGKLLEKDVEISAVKAENQALRQELDRLEARVDSLEPGRGVGTNPVAWIGMFALVVLVWNYLNPQWRRFKRE